MTETLIQTPEANGMSADEAAALLQGGIKGKLTRDEIASQATALVRQLMLIMHR